MSRHEFPLSSLEIILSVIESSLVHIYFKISLSSSTRKKKDFNKKHNEFINWFGRSWHLSENKYFMHEHKGIYSVAYIIFYAINKVLNIFFHKGTGHLLSYVFLCTSCHKIYPFKIIFSYSFNVVNRDAINYKIIL